MEQLFLEDLAKYSEEDIRKHFLNEYQAPQEEIDKYDILVAYESVGSWGCDSSSLFILKNREDGKLYWVNGSHCSCYGFETQFIPEETTVEALKMWANANHVYFVGGYDTDPGANTDAVKDYILNKL